MTEIVLCGRPNNCCPILVVLEDDGTIRKKLTKEEVEILKQKIKDGEL